MKPAQALDMLAVFESIGVKAFDVTITDIKGEKVPGAFRANRGVDQIRAGIVPLLDHATRARENFIIRPRSTAATLIQLDDLPADAAAKIAGYAFMVLCTSPGNFQAWVAVKDAPADFARRLRKGAGADPSASGATRISGSLNFKTKYAPAFPLVDITEANPGRITTADELDRAGFVAPAEEAPRRVSNRVSQPGRAGKARRWPSYALCVQNAPPVHQGERPDISRADFTWCMMAIDWGHSPEDTARRLMEESAKAQENGEGYAATTATNAAAAVARRAERLKPPATPGSPRQP
jgi:DNA primase RepB-like protein